MISGHKMHFNKLVTVAISIKHPPKRLSRQISGFASANRAQEESSYLHGGTAGGFKQPQEILQTGAI